MYIIFFNHILYFTIVAGKYNYNPSPQFKGEEMVMDNLLEESVLVGSEDEGNAANPSIVSAASTCEVSYMHVSGSTLTILGGKQKCGKYTPIDVTLSSTHEASKFKQ